MSEHYRRRPVYERGERVKGLFETSNTLGLHWEIKAWDRNLSEEAFTRLDAANLADAIQLAHRHHGKDEAEKPLGDGRKKLRDAAPDFLDNISKGRKTTTVRARRKDLDLHILPVLGGYSFREIEANPTLVMKVIERMQENGYVSGGSKTKGTAGVRKDFTSSALAGTWASISAFLTWACKPQVQLMRVNPCHLYKMDDPEMGFRVKAIQPVDVSEIPSEQTIARLVASVSKQNEQKGRLTEVVYETGARINEILGLEVNRIFVKERKIELVQQLLTDDWPNVGPLKGELSRGGGEMRTIPMTERCAEIIHEQLQFQMARGQHGGFLFTSEWEQPFHYASARNFLIEAYERCGIERPGTRLWHGFRHAWAIRHFAMPGVSLEQVSRYLGHTTVEMTRKRYIAFVDQTDEFEEYRKAEAEYRRLKAQVLGG